MVQRPVRLLSLAVAVLVGETAARADDAGWEFNLVPYVWAAGIDGTLSHRNLPVRVGVSQDFGEILESLDIGAMVAFEGRRGRWGFLLDGLYVEVSDRGRLPIVGLPVDTGARTFTGLAAVQYRLVDDPHGSLDLTAGARYWSISTRLGVDLPITLPPPLPPLPPGRYDAQESADWVDAMAGAKAVVRLAPRVTVNAHLMLGGGGSAFSSDAMAGLGFGVSDNVSLLAAWRHLSADYRGDAGFRFDARMHGPAVGASIRF